MADVNLSEPDVVRISAPVDDRGRVGVGKELAGETVNVYVEKCES